MSYSNQGAVAIRHLHPANNTSTLKEEAYIIAGRGEGSDRITSPRSKRHPVTGLLISSPPDSREDDRRMENFSSSCGHVTSQSKQVTLMKSISCRPTESKGRPLFGGRMTRVSITMQRKRQHFASFRQIGSRIRVPSLLLWKRFVDALCFCRFYLNQLSTYEVIGQAAVSSSRLFRRSFPSVCLVMPVSQTVPPTVRFSFT